MKTTDRLKIAGNQLIKGNVGNAVKSLYVPETTLVQTDGWRGFGKTAGSSNNGFWAFGMGPSGSDVHFSYSSLTDALKAYMHCPPVAAIINRKTQAHLNGKTWILNTQGKAKDKEAEGAIATKVRNLLANPNPIQGWSEFDAQMKAFVTLFGFCPILVVKPVGFAAIDATSLWILPPWLLEIEETDEIFYLEKVNQVKKITFVWNGHSKNIPVEDVFFVKDTTISFNSFVLPQSRIKALVLPINNVLGAYISRNVLINRRGAMGILSNAGKDNISQIPLDEKEKQRVQNDLMRYGLRSDQWQVIVTSAALQWQQMGYPTKDLMLMEEVQGSTMTICDGLGYQYRLLNENASNSLGGSDVNEFRKLLYVDHIIPEANSLNEQLSNGLFELYKYNLRMEKDFSDVPALQDDKVKMATARFQNNRAALIEFQNNVITLNEWKVRNGDDPIAEDWGKLYYHQLIKAGYVFGGPGNPASNSNTDPNSDPENTNNENGQGDK